MTLDPTDWTAFRQQAHVMLDDMLDYQQHLRQRPTWQPLPSAKQPFFQQDSPLEPQDLPQVHQEFLDHILPYTIGNPHPGFMGWVHGGGTPVGMLAEMLAGGLNVNAGGRHQAPIQLERQLLAWIRQWFEFPPQASGLFVTGTSMANLIGVWVAQRARLGPCLRAQGLAGQTQRALVAYASAGAHGCIAQALDLSGLGTQALHLIPMNDQFQMDPGALRARVRADRAAGLEPFLVVGTAGSVDVGAVDDLADLAALCAQEGLWFHVDGAFGALGCLSPQLAPRFRGIQRADSIAFDFHKWGQVPYDAGFILVREDTLQRQAFATPAAYLRRDTRGAAAGSPWPCDYGPDLSRGFRALKTWFTLKVYGTRALGEMMAHTCTLAQQLGALIAAQPRLELLAPITLNIVCFRFRCPDPNTVNAQLLIELQESGLALPSSTTLKGQFALRAALVNHRTTLQDLEILVAAVLRLGMKLAPKPD